MGRHLPVIADQHHIPVLDALEVFLPGLVIVRGAIGDDSFTPKRFLWR